MLTISSLVHYDTLLQNVTAILLENMTKLYYKMRQVFYYKMRQFITQCVNFITKCDNYYKMRRYTVLNIATLTPTLMSQEVVQNVSQSSP